MNEATYGTPIDEHNYKQTIILAIEFTPGSFSDIGRNICYWSTTLQNQDNQQQNFFIRLPATGWHDLQQVHYKRIGLKNTGKRWLMAFIRIQWAVTLDIWKYQNDIAHNKTDGVEANEINDAIRVEY